MANDLMERLHAYSRDDHERGCQGREYDCSCGYDAKRDPLLEEAAARIEQLEAALREIKSECIELMRLDDGTTEETLTGYARGVYFAAKHIKNRAALGEKA